MKKLQRLNLLTSQLRLFFFAALLLSASAFAAIPNGNFEAGSYANWTSMSGTAFQNPANKSVSALVSWEDSYYANSGYPDNTTWNESAVGVLRSDTFTYPSNRFI